MSLAKWSLLGLLIGAFMIPAAADARRRRRKRTQQNARKHTGPFSKGKSRISISGGGGRGAMVIGLGYGYYIADGLALEGTANYQWNYEDDAAGNTPPDRFTLRPGVRYVLHSLKPISPYVGAFFSHSEYLGGDSPNYPDAYQSIGARLGAYLQQPNGYAGGGIVYEKILDCEKIGLRTEDCASWYPELNFSFSF